MRILTVCLLSLAFAPLIAAPAPKMAPPSETAIIIADKLDKPTWKMRAAVKWRVDLNKDGGVRIVGWDFSESIASLPREQIKDRVKFPKIAQGSTAWLDVPGDHFLQIDEHTAIKDSWQTRSDLRIEDKVMTLGSHLLEAKFSEWGNEKKRFEFMIREVDAKGRIADANIKAGNGTTAGWSSNLKIRFACPDGQTVYTQGSVALGGLTNANSGMRKHENWRLTGREKITSWLTVEWAIANKK